MKTQKNLIFLVFFILLFFVLFIVFSSPTNAICSGCLVNSQCFSIGSILSQTYCDINGNFLNQKSLDSGCQNDFECLSGKCSNGKCIDLGVIFDQNKEKTSLIQSLIGFNVQVIQPPSGNNGGGGSSSFQRIVETIRNIKAGEIKVLEINDRTSDVSRISFKLNNNKNSIGITIRKRDSTYIGKGINYKSFEIELTGVQNNEFLESKMQFRVNKKWLNSNGYGKNDIILKKLVNNNWVDLSTKYLTEDSSYYIYESETRGFSLFSIVAERISQKEENLCGNGIIDTGETCRSCSLDVKCQNDEICDNSGTCQRKTQQIQQPAQQIEQPPIQEAQPKLKTIDLILKNYLTALIVGIVLLVLLIAAIIIYLIATRKPNYKEEPWEEMSENERRNYERLKNIIEENLSKGYSKEQIKQGALDSGWDENLVEKVMRNIK